MSSIPGNSIKLHIGGVERREGWSILNIVPGPHVDYVGNCVDLSFLGDACCDEVYASHVLEHLGHAGELQAALGGIFRVLRPGGRLRVSVPDLEVLCQLFLASALNVKERYQVMKMMFGAQVDAHDVHHCGLTFEFLGLFLRNAGFEKICRVETFDDFNDTNQMRFGGHLISVNAEAYKPPQ